MREWCVFNGVVVLRGGSPDNTEYRIYPDTGGSPPSTWISGPEVIFEYNDLVVGVDEYILEYRDVVTGCSVLETITLKQPLDFDVSYDIVSCNPYKISLEVDTPQQGLTTWSNGMTGQAITVDHGGAYQVRFQPFGDFCEVVKTIEIPKSPEEYAWIFPDGCLDYCSIGKYFPYIIGPVPSFDSYQYALDSQDVLSGSGIVEEFVIEDSSGTAIGELTLTLENEFCAFETPVLDIKEGSSCLTACNFNIAIDSEQDIHLVTDGPYWKYVISGGTLTNNASDSFYVQVLAPDVGAFVPSYLGPIPGSGGVYDFSVNPLTLIPDIGFAGGVSVHIEFVGYPLSEIYSEVGCFITENLDFPPPGNRSQLESDSDRTFS